jgi:AcrR family transcriptional regulator
MVLIRAAAELLHQDGYLASSMADIASAAGITKGGLYFHFKSKDEVCEAVQDAAIAMLRAYADQQSTWPLSAIQRLIDLTHTLMSWLDSEPVAGASLRMAREVGANNELFVAFSRAWYEHIRQGIRDAEANGELGDRVPVDVATLLVAVMSLGIEMLVATKTMHADTDLSAGLADMWSVVLPEITGSAEHTDLEPRGSSYRDS